MNNHGGSPPNNQSLKYMCIEEFIQKAGELVDKIHKKCWIREIYVEDAERYEMMVWFAVSNFCNRQK